MMKRLTVRAARRRFLRTAAAALGGTAAWTWSGVSHARQTPAERVRIGCIGLGNQGMPNLRRVIDHVVAVCDVDSARLAEGKSRVEAHAKETCFAARDFRRLLDRKDVDAVVVTTPDHWHGLQTVLACLAGKDVYCEKPLTLCIEEGRSMVAAARKHRRVVQTGSQQRSDARFRRACELVRSGRLGKILEVECGLSAVNFRGQPQPDGDPPAELDYDLWLGPAPARQYNAGRVHYNFRFFWDYSGGQQTNWGAHHLDIAQWGLGMDDSGPVSIEGRARFDPAGVFEVPAWSHVVYRYANGVVLKCGHDYRGGARFIGERGEILVTRKELIAKPDSLAAQPSGPDDVRLEVSDNHFANWIDCIKTRNKPICDVEIGHRSATVCHLGNIAIRAGRPIAWDPVAEQVVGDSEAAALAGRTYRRPWSMPVI